MSTLGLQRLFPLYKPPAKKAFTMVEILIVLGIVGLMASMTAWYLFSGKTEATTTSRNIYFHEARKGMMRITQELRQSKEIQSILDEKGIEFRSADGNIVTYTMSNRMIVRREDQSVETVANSVIAFNIVPLPPVIRKTIDITISCGPEGSEMGDPDTLSLNTAIFIR